MKFDPLVEILKGQNPVLWVKCTILSNPGKQKFCQILKKKTVVLKSDVL